MDLYWHQTNSPTKKRSCALRCLTISCLTLLKKSQPMPGIQCQVGRANIVFCLREDSTTRKEAIKRDVLYGGFLKWGYPNSWLVYDEKKYPNGWFWGDPHFRKPPYLCRLLETMCQFICFPWNDQYHSLVTTDADVHLLLGADKPSIDFAQLQESQVHIFRHMKDGVPGCPPFLSVFIKYEPHSR